MGGYEECEVFYSLIPTLQATTGEDEGGRSGPGPGR